MRTNRETIRHEAASAPRLPLTGSAWSVTPVGFTKARSERLRSLWRGSRVHAAAEVGGKSANRERLPDKPDSPAK